MWSQWTEQAKNSLTQAQSQLTQVLEKTGEALTQAATTHSHAGTSRDSTEPTSPPNATGRYSNEQTQQEKEELLQKRQQELVKSLQTGWSSVLEHTRELKKNAQHVVEEQQNLIKSRIQSVRTKFYKRDPNLPLDVKALKDAQVVYITDRIITSSHPAMASSTFVDITPERKLAAIGQLLEKRHEGRYMVWNLSEVEYDASILNEQVLTFSFPGCPSPPLGLLLKLLVSIESWLKADPRNVALIHCLTGKGRTSTVLAAFLCWMQEASFSDIYETLEYIAQCKMISLEELTIPSQRRYASYFKNMLDNVRPSQPPIKLSRIIMSEAPRFARGPPRDDTNKTYTEEDLQGCAPYIQLFKAGNLLTTVPASLHFQQSSNELPFCQVADGSFSFHVNQMVQGDILIRCRHLTAKKQRVSMFRAAFHTGYVPPKVLRLTKSQLDGACSDNRFQDEYFLDIIFEEASAEEAQRFLQDEEEKRQEQQTAVQAGSASAQQLAGDGNKVSASAYDMMLHRDSRFWDVIQARREEHSHNAAATDDPFWGPTVGRRRDVTEKKASNNSKNPSSVSHEAPATFSIGGELDFLPDEEPAVIPDAKTKPPPTTRAAPVEREKDLLMEALESLDQDDAKDNEIVFDGDKPASSEHPDTTSQVATDSAATQDSNNTTQDLPVEHDKDASSSVVPPSTEAKEDPHTSGTATPASDDMEDLLAGMDDLLGDDDDDADLDLDDADLAGLDDDLADLEKFLSS